MTYLFREACASTLLALKLLCVDTGHIKIKTPLCSLNICNYHARKQSSEKCQYLTNINPTSYFTGIVTCPLLSLRVSGGSSLSLKQNNICHSDQTAGWKGILENEIPTALGMKAYYSFPVKYCLLKIN